MITIFLRSLSRSCFDYSFLIPMYAKSRISPIEIFSAFYTQFHDFFRFVDYHYRVPAPAACTYPGYVCGAWMCVPCPGCVYRASSTVFFIFCVPCAKARDFALKCFLAIGRKFRIVFINLDIYVCTST